MTKDNPICIIVPNHVFQLLNPTDFHRGPKGILKQMKSQMFFGTLFFFFCRFGRMQQVVVELTVNFGKPWYCCGWDIKWSSVNSIKRRSGFPAHKNKMTSLNSKRKGKMKHPHREIWSIRCSFILKTIFFIDVGYGQDMLGFPKKCLICCGMWSQNQDWSKNLKILGWIHASYEYFETRYCPGLALIW